MERIRLNLLPLNEGQEMNYCEPFTGTQAEIKSRCDQIIRGLTSMLPRGTFTVMLVDLTFDRAWRYYDGKFHDEEGEEIIDTKLLT